MLSPIVVASKSYVSVSWPDLWPPPDPHFIPLPHRQLASICSKISSFFFKILCSQDWQQTAGRGQWHKPGFRLTTFVGRSLACAAPSTRKSLPDTLKVTSLSLTSFQKQLETFCKVKVKKGKGKCIYTALIFVVQARRSGIGSHSFTCNYLLLPRKRSPDGDPKTEVADILLFN